MQHPVKNTVVSLATHAGPEHEKREERKRKFDAQNGRYAGDIRSQSAAIALQFGQKSERGGCFPVLRPDIHLFVMYSDFVTGAALLYTAIVVPFEAAFVSAFIRIDYPSPFQNPWFMLNRATDLVFIADMCLQFNVAYEQTVRNTGQVGWETNRRKICMHYLKGWFIFDASTIFVPLCLDLYAASQPDFINLGMLRLVRCARLLKMIRVLRASRIVQRWRASISISHSTVARLEIVLAIGMIAHWVACILALTVSAQGEAYIASTWIGAYDLCDLQPESSAHDTNASSDALPGDGTNELAIGLAGCPNMSLGTWYLASLAWSLMLLTATGGLDGYPNRNVLETVIFSALNLAAAFLWTMVIAIFCEIYTNGSPAAVDFQQKLDALNHFIVEENLPLELAIRMRTYLNNERGVIMSEFAKATLPTLSQALLVEVTMHTNEGWMQRTWFIKPLQLTVKVQIAMSLSPRTFAPGEVMPSWHLYLMKRGTAMLGNSLLASGMMWGDDILLSNPDNFSPHLARPLRFAETMCIHRGAVLALMAPFEDSVTIFRRMGILLALKRYLLRVLNEVKQARQRRSLARAVAAPRTERSQRRRCSSFIRRSVDRSPSQADLSSKRLGASSIGLLEKLKSVTRAKRSPTQSQANTVALEIAMAGAAANAGEPEGSVHGKVEELLLAKLDALEAKILPALDAKQQLDNMNEKMNDRFERLERMLESLRSAGSAAAAVRTVQRPSTPRSPSGTLRRQGSAQLTVQSFGGVKP